MKEAAFLLFGEEEGRGGGNFGTFIYAFSPIDDILISRSRSA
jgi:hypothetical protein